ncbi:MAG: hypothetical protein V3U65_01590 [Granulosicoccaceae bacterium]
MQSLTYRLVLCFTIAVLLSGCAGGNSSSGDNIVLRGKILACKSGDTQIDSTSQCLQDDAACYQKADGAWCTGPRGNVCPAGSSKIPEGTECPAGARCFSVGEGLTCGINY